MLHRNERARPKLLLAVAFVGLAAGAAPGLASADELEGPKAAAARALFDDGMRLLDANKYSEACPKLAESNRLDPGMGVKYRLAICYEGAGRLASAWALFVQVADEAAIARMPDREKVARARADGLRLRVPKMLVLVPEDVAGTRGLELKLDGEPLRSAMFGTAIPVDAGKHVISVVAPGKRQWETSAEASESATITVTIPSLKEEPTVGPVGSGATPAQQPMTVAPAWGGQKIAGVVAAGVGAAGLIAGGVLGGLAIGKNNEAAAFCRPDNPALCKAEGVALDQDVKMLGMASTVGFIAGGVLAAGGVVLFLTAPAGGAPAKTGSSVGVRISVGRLEVEGSWR